MARSQHDLQQQDDHAEGPPRIPAPALLNAFLMGLVLWAVIAAGYYLIGAIA